MLGLKLNHVSKRGHRSSVSDTEKLSPLKDSVTSLYHSTQSHVWLTEDCNLPDMEWNPQSVRNGARYSDSYQVFMDMLDEAALTQTVTEPTRDSNTLDLFATNNDTLITRCEVILGISDHNAVLVESRLRPLRQKTPRRSIPIWRKANWDGIRSHISQAWEQLTGNRQFLIKKQKLYLWTYDSLVVTCVCVCGGLCD